MSVCIFCTLLAKAQPPLFVTGVWSPPLLAQIVFAMPKVLVLLVFVGGGHVPTLAPSHPAFVPVAAHAPAVAVNVPVKALGRPSVRSTITFKEPVWFNCFNW
jgi:hypothetical protein